MVIERLNRQEMREAKIAVAHVMTMRLPSKQALEWIKERYNINMSASSLTRLKRIIDKEVTKNLYSVAKGGFMIQHNERIQSMKTIETELWNLYRHARKIDDYKEAHAVLRDLAYIQPYISAYYEATKAVMEFNYKHEGPFTDDRANPFDLDSMGPDDNSIV